MKSILLKHFKNIKKPRIDRKKPDYLQDILSLFVLGICSWNLFLELYVVPILGMRLMDT
jgi:hypothetical protein